MKSVVRKKNSSGPQIVANRISNSPAMRNLSRMICVGHFEKIKIIFEYACYVEQDCPSPT